MNGSIKRVAAVVTEYRRHSHADVIVGKVLEGYNYDHKEKPRMQIVSMYVDQFAPRDMSRDLSKQYNFPIFDSIAEAITLGKPGVNVEGVLCIGEHGTYPRSETGQILYPRRRFFEEVTNVFARYDRSVPVFSDKHLAARWEDALWMYNRSRELFVPFLAGSSVPTTWRQPELEIPRGTELVEAVQLGYGPVEGYGFHALEGLQCMVERRRGGEVGVQAVKAFVGREIWEALDQRIFSPELTAAVLGIESLSHARVDVRRSTRGREAVAFLIEYRDGFKSTVLMPNGWIYEGRGGAFAIAIQAKNRKEPQVTHFFLQQPDPFGHFGYQVRAIDFMMQTGHAPWPVERTLLTTGILEALMLSLHEKGRRLETPHLAIRYTPTDWGFARDPIPPAIKR